MQTQFLNLLCCPVTKQPLQFQLISEFEKKYSSGMVKEIREGLLFSSNGLVFPVIDGIPRLLIEAMEDYAGFMKKHLADYEKRMNELGSDVKKLIRDCAAKNHKTKQSFEFEWGFLDVDKKDKIWHKDHDELLQVFMSEMGVVKNTYGKMADVGCGHGVMTSVIAGVSEYAVGMELSAAVESAYIKNQQQNAWFVQADLQFLPFANEQFDGVYSSGVIHHTNDTHRSFTIIEQLVKKGGLLCVWLYHPQKNLYHTVSLLLRKVISRLPIQLAFVLIAVFIFPFTYLIKKIRNKKPVNYREELIYLFDSFTPEFRFEIPQSTATGWYKDAGYTEVNITTEDQYGYSVKGVKG